MSTPNIWPIKIILIKEIPMLAFTFFCLFMARDAKSVKAVTKYTRQEQ